jgi:hypothetical protein
MSTTLIHSNGQPECLYTEKEAGQAKEVASSFFKFQIRGPDKEIPFIFLLHVSGGDGVKIHKNF